MHQYDKNFVTEIRKFVYRPILFTVQRKKSLNTYIHGRKKKKSHIINQIVIELCFFSIYWKTHDISHIELGGRGKEGRGKERKRKEGRGN